MKPGKVRSNKNGPDAQGILETWAAGYQARDVAKVMSVFDPDLRYIAPCQPEQTFESLASWFRNDFGRHGPLPTWNFAIESVRRERRPGGGRVALGVGHELRRLFGRREPVAQHRLPASRSGGLEDLPHHQRSGMLRPVAQGREAAATSLGDRRGFERQSHVVLRHGELRRLRFEQVFELRFLHAQREGIARENGATGVSATRRSARPSRCAAGSAVNIHRAPVRGARGSSRAAPRAGRTRR